MNDAVNDPEILEMLYWHEGLSLWQIAQRLDCSESVVYDRMRKFGIDRRGRGAKRRGQEYKKYIPYNCYNGYPQWDMDSDVDGASTVRVHQLLAVAKGADPHDVFGGENAVHHKNGVKWDNRPENIELMSVEDHGRHHAKELGQEFFEEIGGRSKYTKQEILEWLELFIEEMGFVPASTDLRGWPGPSPSTIAYRFDGFDNAIRALGEEPRGSE